ncbi:glycosyltransferase family 4 protein [Tamlana sp. I1]|uniref:glycosyltransferase family 4 protein n=1 Tax=Tamlana sp. I1 TaxID=2762061 RepID=UPI001E2F80B3|nr:glycosyltransferase family 4 protein [Tamlana sp. I1]
MQKECATEASFQLIKTKALKKTSITHAVFNNTIIFKPKTASVRVLQLIDSLHAGGAERVAVNYANALSQHLEYSYLCATRAEGLLKDSLFKNVHYLFLNKKRTLDFRAIKKLNRFVKANNIDVIHAHSTSYFFATLIKLLNPKLILIWHDHYGNSEFLEERSTLVLKNCAKLFNHVFTVNLNLKHWVETKLQVQSVSYLPNFAVTDSIKPQTKLKGEEDKRIVCLANLRPQKDHINLLKAFKTVLEVYPDWTLHLVGKDFNDAYASEVRTYIIQNNLKNHVFIYGSCPDVSCILNSCAIGVLSSKSEGLPLALLEYGLAGLAVITTNVGDCNQVISTKNEGLLIEPENDAVLAQALITYISNAPLRLQVAENLKTKVVDLFSESHIIKSLIAIYTQYYK